MLDLLGERAGQVAALATAVCWTFCALCFEFSSRRIGSLSVNVIKMYVAFVLFAVFAGIFRGLPLPTDASGFSWLWLGLSGVIGFVVGDLFLFKAFATIGARTSMLIMSLVPLVTTVFAYFMLGETLEPLHYLGMALTVSGVSVVILTREGESKKLKHPVQGIVFAFIGMCGQAVGLIFGKYGMGEYNAFSATQIRIIAGLIGFTILLFYRGGWGSLKMACKNGVVMKVMMLGSILGPFLGVYLSLVALQNTETGVASTIMAIVPVMIIPFSIRLFGEKINLREVIGAIVAVVGTGLMFS